MIAGTPVDVIAEFYPALAGMDQTGSLEPLRRVPTLVLTGDKDRMIPKEHSELLVRAAGRRRDDASSTSSCPDAGHLVLLEKPERGHRGAGPACCAGSTGGGSPPGDRSGPGVGAGRGRRAWPPLARRGPTPPPTRWPAPPPRRRLGGAGRGGRAPASPAPSWPPPGSTSSSGTCRPPAGRGSCWSARRPAPPRTRPAGRSSGSPARCWTSCSPRRGWTGPRAPCSTS